MVILNRRIIIILLLAIFTIIKSPDTVNAGVYDNAYSYYQKYGGKNSDIARINPGDGCIYFVSSGSTATSNICYRTVGYTITICSDKQQDSVEVKLDGKYIKTVSTEKKGGYTYVLRKADFNKLKLLFNGNKNISWKQIFMQTNTYRFDAIMTVAESGKALCGSITESSDYRKITAKDNAYLFRTAKGIKNARNWANPADLDNFFGKFIVFEPVQSLKADDLAIEKTDNVYYADSQYYVRKGSVVNVSVKSSLKNTDSADKCYQPDYNMIRVTGWGNDQVFYMAKKSSGEKCVSGLIKESGNGSSPLAHKGTVNDKCNGTADSIIDFKSCAGFVYNVADGKYISLVPEARIYYNMIYPDKLSDDDNLCENNVNPKTKKKLVSDANGPDISVVSLISGFGFVQVPFTVTDNGSGISFVSIYNENGELLVSQDYSKTRQTYIISNDIYTINVKKDEKYYIMASDNVGNVNKSGYFTFSVPIAHTIEHTFVRGFNGYNCEKAVANIYGGNSEIARLLIMSEAEDNPNNKRIVYVDLDVESKTLAPNQYCLAEVYNPMSKINNLKDGTYWIDVISGGRYANSEPKRYYIHKDTTPANIKYDASLGTNGWQKGSAPFKIEVTDNYSGISSSNVICDGEVLSGSIKQDYIAGPIKGSYNLDREGIKTIEIQVYDVARNYSSLKKVLKIDATAPEYTLSDEFIGTDIVKDKWINASSLCGRMTVEDNLCGFNDDRGCFNLFKCVDGSTREVDRDDYEVKFDDNNKAHIYFSPEYCSRITSGKYRYLYELSDMVDNKKKVNLYLNVDIDAPVVDSDTDNPWDSTALKGRFKVYDEHSGIDSVELKINDVIVDSIYGVDKNEYIMNCELNEADVYGKNVHLYVTDKAGNSCDYPIETAFSEIPLDVSASVVRADNNGAPIFVSGDIALLSYSAYEYVDRIAVTFPQGLEEYNVDINNVSEYIHSDSIEFVIPDEYNGYYNISVIAYRNDMACEATVTFNVTRKKECKVRTRIRK